jgi:hypothetical protein
MAGGGAGGVFAEEAAGGLLHESNLVHGCYYQWLYKGTMLFANLRVFV